MPLVRTAAVALAFCASLALVECVHAADSAAAPPKPPYRIVQRGSVMLPQSAPDHAGNDVPITGLSGIAWLGDEQYAAIMDNSDLVVLFSLALARDGTPEEPRDVRVLTLSEKHDYEDIAPCPEPLQQRIAARRVRQGFPDPGRCLLVAEEDTPAIRAISLADGSLLGVIPIPDKLVNQRYNRGLESLAVEADGRHLWTANEEALPADGPGAAAEDGTVVRLTCIALQPPEETGERHPKQLPYRVDPPHDFVRVFGGEPLSGVAAVNVIDDDHLLVLERSGTPGLPPFENRLYLVDPRGIDDVTDVDSNLSSREDASVPKVLLWKDQLGCNIEGLCLGPKLPDGHRTLLAVADNGAVGTPNQLVTFAIEAANPPLPIPLLVGGAFTVAMLVALLIYRLAR